MDITYSIKKYALDKQGRVRFVLYEIRTRGYSYQEKTCKTVLSQDLALRCDKHGHWHAEMLLSDMRPTYKGARFAIGKMANWLKRMSEAVEHLTESLEIGLENPLENAHLPPYQMDSQAKQWRYSLSGLRKKLKEYKCPLEPINQD